MEIGRNYLPGQWQIIFSETQVDVSFPNQSYLVKSTPIFFQPVYVVLDNPFGQYFATSQPQPDNSPLVEFITVSLK